MDVSLLGLVFSQSVSTLAVCWVFVVQILSPGRMFCGSRSADPPVRREREPGQRRIHALLPSARRLRDWRVRRMCDASVSCQLRFQEWRIQRRRWTLRQPLLRDRCDLLDRGQEATAGLAPMRCGDRDRLQNRSALRTALTPLLAARSSGEDEPARRLARTSTVWRGSTCTRRTSAA